MPFRRCYGDIRLCDSADSKVHVGRLRKAATSRWETLDSEHCDVTVTEPARKHAQHKESDNRGYRVLTQDIWDTIGKYIRPENVSTFARLCRFSYYVTLRVSFWLSLYYRYVEGFEEVDAVEVRGLRASVIRALHRVHGPLRRKTFGGATDRIIGARCCGFWQVAKTDSPTMCFLFQSLNQRSNERHQRLSTSSAPSVVEQRRSLYENCDENLMALTVITNDYASSRHMDVLGLVLIKIAVTIDVGVMPKMKLQFAQSCYKMGGGSTFDAYNSTTVMISSLKDYKLLEWWEPQFVQLKVHQQDESEESSDW